MRQRLAHEGFGVELRPLARGHRDFAELLPLRAVLVHVARGGQRIGEIGRSGRYGASQAAGRMALQQVAGGAALVAAVGDQRDVAQAGIERQRRQDRVHLERGAAGAVVVREARLDAQVFGQGQAGQGVSGSTTNRPSTSEGLQPGLGERPHAGRAARSIELSPGASPSRRWRRRRSPSCRAGNGPRSCVHPPAGVEHDQRLVVLAPMRACTAMPMCTASGAMPSTRLIMRGPSARSTSATL